MDLLAKVNNYEDLHSGLRVIYDALDFKDEESSKFKILLINYCSDIVLLARNHEVINETNIESIESRKELLDYCNEHVA